MTTPRHPDPIVERLQETEVRLQRQLGEVCAMRDVSGESTGEFIRLEEKLVEAAETAKQAFSLRRRRRLASGGTAAGAAVDTARASLQAAGLGEKAPAEAAPRTVSDGDGTLWHVWAVSAARMRANPLTGDSLGEYRDGWLAFESEDGSRRRRLPHFPDGWATMSDAELLQLLARAEAVRPVKRMPRSSQEQRPG